jgi:hypothetical protein
MTADRDVLWTDLLQFDPPSADKVWDGELHDLDAPGWYADLGSLIHRAQGPAEPDELVDEPEVVATMRRASLGAAIVALPRHRGVRSVGRVVAMKAAAAATTVSMVGVAAAATTGIVATVAATVVVPAIQEKVRPVIEHHIVPVEPSQPPGSENTSTQAPGEAECRPRSDLCADPSAPVVVDAPPAPSAAPMPATADPAVTTTTTAPAPTEPPPTVADAPVADAPAEPAQVEPTAEPAPTDPAPIEPTADPAPVEPLASDPAPDTQSKPSADARAGGPHKTGDHDESDNGASVDRDSE